MKTLRFTLIGLASLLLACGSAPTKVDPKYAGHCDGPDIWITFGKDDLMGYADSKSGKVLVPQHYEQLGSSRPYCHVLAKAPGKPVELWKVNVAHRTAAKLRELPYTDIRDNGSRHSLYSRERPAVVPGYLIAARPAIEGTGHDLLLLSAVTGEELAALQNVQDDGKAFISALQPSSMIMRTSGTLATFASWLKVTYTDGLPGVLAVTPEPREARPARLIDFRTQGPRPGDVLYFNQRKLLVEGDTLTPLWNDLPEDATRRGFDRIRILGMYTQPGDVIAEFDARLFTRPSKDNTPLIDAIQAATHEDKWAFYRSTSDTWQVLRHGRLQPTPFKDVLSLEGDPHDLYVQEMDGSWRSLFKPALRGASLAEMLGPAVQGQLQSQRAAHEAKMTREVQALLQHQKDLEQQARAAQEKAALEAANRERHRVSDRPVYTPPSGGTAARSGDNRSTEQRLRDDAFWDNYQRCGFGKC